MSYILDALQKSERARGAVPDLHVVHSEPRRAATNRLPASAGMIALALAAAVLWLGPWQRESGNAVVAESPLALQAVAIKPRKLETVAAPKPDALKTPQAEAVTTPLSMQPVAKVRARPPQPAAGPVSAAIVYFSQLPAALQRELPKLVVSGYANLSDDPSTRVVAVGDRLLREKDEVAPGVVVEKIAPDGPIFSYKGYRFRAS